MKIYRRLIKIYLFNFECSIKRLERYTSTSFIIVVLLLQLVSAPFWKCFNALYEITWCNMIDGCCGHCMLDVLISSLEVDITSNESKNSDIIRSRFYGVVQQTEHWS